MKLKIDHDTMMTSFNQLLQEVIGGLSTVDKQLEAREYTKATESMEIISKRMAQTSVMMRNLMIRAGMIKT